MSQESPTVPYVWLLLSNIVTALLTVSGTLTALWFKGKREPVELAKINAETRQITINTDVTLIQAATSAIEKAEQRHSEGILREEQMRTQTLFWRNKAEELDGELIDSREANGLLQSRYKLKKTELDKAMALLKYHDISYAELDTPKSE